MIVDNKVVTPAKWVCSSVIVPWACLFAFRRCLLNCVLNWWWRMTLSDRVHLLLSTVDYYIIIVSDQKTWIVVTPWEQPERLVLTHSRRHHYYGFEPFGGGVTLLLNEMSGGIIIIIHLKVYNLCHQTVKRCLYSVDLCSSSNHQLKLCLPFLYVNMIKIVKPWNTLSLPLGNGP